jgi:hypothetical protein
MKHVSLMAKSRPAPASILGWPAEVKGPGRKAAYINQLNDSDDSLDPEDFDDYPFFE